MKKEYNLIMLKSLEYFFENPYEEIHLREFARKLKISLNSAQRFLNFFVQENLIKDERKANLRYFKANLESNFFKHLKISYLIGKIEGIGLVDFFKEKNFSSIVLFGSCAEGTDSNGSDIDLVCIGPVKINISKFREKIDRELNTHFFTWSEWKKQAKDNKAFYQDVVVKGINLLGEKPIVE